MRIPSIVLLPAYVLMLVAPCDAGYPFISKFTTQATGPYAPRVDRYIVVDPAPAAPDYTQGPHGHHQAAASQPLWTRRDDPAPVYPYGWFGARAATNNWSHTGYYNNYVDQRILRGR